MQIYASQVFKLLADKRRMLQVSAAANERPIEKASIWRGQTVTPGCLYIAECQAMPLPLKDATAVLMFSPAAQDPSQAGAFEANASQTVFACATPASATELLEQVGAIMLDLQTWDNRLKDACFASASLERVFEIGRSVIGELSSIVDIDLGIIVGVPAQQWSPDSQFSVINDSSKRPHLPSDAVERLLMEEDYSQAALKRDVFFYPYRMQDARFVCGNIFHGSRCQARLVAVCPRSLCELSRIGLAALLRQLLEYVRQTLVGMLDSEGGERADDAFANELRHMLYAPAQFSTERLLAAALEFGWQENDRFQLVHIRFFRGAYWQTLANYLCGQLEGSVLQSRAVAHGDEIVWFINKSLLSDEDNEKLPARLTAAVREYACKVGLSRDFIGMDGILAAGKEATIALEVGQRKSPHFWTYKFDDYVTDYLYERMTGELDAANLVHPGIARLEAHDAANSTNYAQVLRAYFDCGFNATNAAEKLFVHRTTLMRHLASIPKISGFDPHDPQTRLELCISFWLLGQSEREPATPLKHASAGS